MKKNNYIYILPIFFGIIFGNGCKEESTTQSTGSGLVKPISADRYFPIKSSLSLLYRVTFPVDAQVPYSPVIEYPEGLLSTSFTHGLAEWKQGTVQFTITTTVQAESSSTVLAYEADLDQNAYKFFFNIAGDYQVQMRRKKQGDTLLYDLVGILPIDIPGWKIAHRLFEVYPNKLSDTVTITSDGVQYKGCLHSVIKIIGDGLYVPTGTYEIDVYCAVDIGIVKMIGKDRDGTVLYTMELVSQVSPPPPTEDLSGSWTGFISSNLITNTPVTFVLLQNGTTVTGSYSAGTGAIGLINATIGDVIDFTLTQTNSTCPGSFTGIAVVSNDTLYFTYSGSDCLGTHTNGIGLVVRQSSSNLGTISVSSFPSGASITMNGVITGKVTPSTFTNVSPGTYTIKLSRADYADTTVSVTVAAGQTKSVNVALRASGSTGSISILTTPSDADIFLDGVYTGLKSPTTIQGIGIGQHYLTLSHSGYADSTIIVNILNQQTTFVSITLRQIITTADSIFIVLRLDNLPKTLKFNRSHIPDYYTEYNWAIYFNTDDNQTTGLNGYDVEICSNYYKKPGVAPFDGSPVNSTMHLLIEWEGTSGYTRHSNVRVWLHPADSNTLYMAVPTAWPEVTGIDNTDEFYLEAYYYDSTYSVTDQTLTSTGTDWINDEKGDAAYPFIDILAGKWDRSAIFTSPTAVPSTTSHRATTIGKKFYGTNQYRIANSTEGRFTIIP